MATNLQRKVCNLAIEKGLVEANDAIEYRFSNARLKEIENGHIRTQNKRDNSVACTLQCDPTKIGYAVRTANKKGYDIARDGDSIDLAYPNSTTRRGRVGHGVSKTIATGDTMGTMQDLRIRKLTPKECWRLMGFDDEDFEKASKVNSNSQLYKQAGNSIVVNVLEGILRNLLLNQ